MENRDPQEKRAPHDREPYYEGYFGTEEEEGVVREQDDAEVEDGEGEGGEVEDEGQPGRPPRAAPPA